MNGPKIAKIDQSKLRENVYESLRDAFTRGEFAPGDSVNLRGLADQLGTSMTPVREAVRRLVAEGALIDTPSRTLMVPPFDARRMQDLKKARLALEVIVLDQAMDRIDDEALTEMEAILSPPKRPDRTSPDLQQNYDFHFSLYRRSQSEVLLPLIEALWLQYGAYLNLIIHDQKASQMDEHEHHHEIVKALRKDDRREAKEALTRDIERSFRVIVPDNLDGATR
ncbi:MAG: GntR family transcriptional regulator [Pseudomonadota bacterium]